MNEELMQEMRQLVRGSKARRTILLAKPLVTAGGKFDQLVANLPLLIVKAHLNRKHRLEVCEAVDGFPYGFDFPERTRSVSDIIAGCHNLWSSAEAPEVEWLREESRKIYDYCLSIGLNPTLSNFYKTQQFIIPAGGPLSYYNTSRIEISWSPQELDGLPGLEERNITDEKEDVALLREGDLSLEALRELSRASRDRAIAAKEQRETELHQAMEELCPKAAREVIAKALEKMEDAASKGDEVAAIYFGSVDYSGFGKQLRCNHDQFVSDARLFDNPDCWDAVVTRGLIMWAEHKGVRPTVCISRNRAGGSAFWHLSMTVSWGSRVP